MQIGVIFDVDGVLVDSGAAHAASWRAVAKTHGIDISDEQFKRTFGRPSRDIIRIIWGEGVSEDEIRHYDDAKEASYRDLISGRVPLAAGARQAKRIAPGATFDRSAGYHVTGAGGRMPSAGSQVR